MKLSRNPLDDLMDVAIRLERRSRLDMADGSARTYREKCPTAQEEKKISCRVQTKKRGEGFVFSVVGEAYPAGRCQSGL